MLHRIPFFGNPHKEAVKRRKRWVDFVKLKRVWTDTKGATICSRHFTHESFKRRFYNIEGQEEPCAPRLIDDEIGCAAFPTIMFPPESDEEEDPSRPLQGPSATGRSRRKVPT